MSNPNRVGITPKRCQPIGVLGWGAVLLLSFLFAPPQQAQGQSAVLGLGGGYQVIGSEGSEPSPVASVLLQLGLARTLFIGYGLNAVFTSTNSGAREVGHGPLADIYLKNTPGWQPHLQAGYQWNRVRGDLGETLDPWQSLVGGLGLRRGAFDVVFRGTFPNVENRSSFLALEVHLGCLCGGGGEPEFALRVRPSHRRLTALRDTAQLEASWSVLTEEPLEPGRGAAASRPVVPGDSLTWATADPLVATVDQTGLVTATGNGATEVLALARRGAAQAAISVEQVPTELSVTPERVEMLAIGETEEIVAVVRDRLGAEVSGAVLRWSSSSPAVVSVDATGRVTAEAHGTAIITARSGALAAPVEITVMAVPASVEVAQPNPLTALNETLQLSATVRDRTGSVIPSADVRWSVATPGVANVDSEGRVTALANGEVEVTAAIENASKTVLVNVRQQAAVVEIVPREHVTLELGETWKLTVIGRDANGYAIDNLEVEWISSAPEVVTVDGDGLAIAHGFGVATVTARAGDASASVTVTASSGRAHLRASGQR